MVIIIGLDTTTTMFFDIQLFKAHYTIFDVHICIRTSLCTYTRISVDDLLMDF